MNGHKHHTKAKSLLYGLLSFFLTLTLFLLSICLVMQTTIFSKSFMTSAMGSCGYYTMVADELKSQLKSLGDASGLDQEFAQDFVEGYDVQSAVDEYISAFYVGDTTLVDTEEFEQELYAALDDYIDEKGIDRETVSDENLSYFVSQACDIYVNEISIPFFSYVANYIYNYSTPLLIITIVLAVIALAIAAVIIFTNKFTHRRYRYLCYSTTGTTLATAIIPITVQLSGMISKINLETRSLYNLFVSYANALFSYFWIYCGIFFVVSVILFLLYAKAYKRATTHHGH